MGSASNGDGGRALAMHYDGESWTDVDTPEVELRSKTEEPHATLRDVAGVAPDDVWAAGDVANFNPPGPSDSVLMHWDGVEWQTVESPHLADEDGETFEMLFGLAAVSSQDVWALGISADEPGFGGNDDPLVLHYDATAWALGGPPQLSNGVVLNAAVPNGSGILAVGSSTNRPVLLSWDGETWTSSPVPSEKLGVLTDIAIAEKNEVWAVGSGGSERDVNPQALALHCGP